MDENKPINILFAEDLPTDAEMARCEISKGKIHFNYRLVDTEQEFRKELNDFNPDIVVSDYSMPSFDGMTALKIAREYSPFIPFIVLTGSMNEETAVACMKAGANDYVIKEQIKRLPFAVKEAIEKSRVRIEKEKAEEELKNAHEQLDATLNALPDLLFEIDRETILYDYRAPDSRLLYLPPSEFLGKPMKDVLPGEVGEKLLFALDKASKTGRCSGVDYSLKIDGLIYWFDMSVSTKKHVDGLRYILLIRNITEQKKAESELKESEEKFRKIFENHAAAKMIVDPATGNILDVNNAAAEFYGWSRDELKQMTIFDINIVSPDKVKDKMKKLDIDHLMRAESTHILKNGEKREVEVFSSTIDVNGEIFYHSIIHDITDRKRFEKDLIVAKEKAEENELRFMQMYENTSIGIGIISLDFKFLGANHAFCNMLGYSENEFIGKTLNDITHPEIIDRNLELQNQLKKGLIMSFQLEKPFIHKDGHTVYGIVNSTLIRNTQNEPMYFLGNVQDITEIKKVEREIQLQNNRLESLLKIAQYPAESIQKLLDFALEEAIKLTNSKIGHIFNFDEKTERFSRNSWSKSVMEACSIKEPQIIHDLDNAGLWTEAVRERKPILINDYKAPNSLKKGLPDGHVSIQKYLAVPVISGNNVVAVLGVANKETNYDLSDIRQLSLLMYTVWRTGERLKLIEDLKEAKEKAEESDHLKSAFLANMSHEIRTPMNGILGFTNLLSEPDVSDENMTMYIEIIQQSGQRMLNTLNDIIEISKIETNQISISNEEINIAKQVETLAMFFEPECKKRELNLIIGNSLKEEETTIYIDKSKIDSILTNLLKNAIKFTKAGTIEIGITRKTDFLEFYVRDTGIGIPEDKLDRIFDRFIQAELKLSRGYEGSGLGLSIAKSYVEMLGGKIWVESKLEKGSTFFFTVPFSPVPDNSSGDTKEKGDENIVINKNLDILIVEDDNASMSYLKWIFKNNCREIFSASNGKDAIETIKANPSIDLILMDIKMPKMDGYEATREIREFNKEVKIIAQTAFALSGDREKAINAGCDDYIDKPVEKIRLFELLNKYFS